jgi:hypothetical protein
MKTICFCASAAFYKHVNQLADQAAQLGYTPVVPKIATTMRQSGNYEVAAIKTWYQNPDDYSIKRQLMDEHFKKVAESDATLVVNDQKYDVDGYIGPNVLMELAIAYYLHKQIYVLNDVNPNNSTYEEVMGMGVISLHGDLTNLKLA